MTERRYGIAFLVSLGLVAIAFGQEPLLATQLLGKPLVQVETALGKPRHVARAGERYYKKDGFVRIVATFSAQKTLESVTFQFAPGEIDGERAALVRVGGSLPTGWTSKWSAPGESNNDELFLFRPATVRPKPLALTRHFLERMRERGVSEAQAIDLLERGQLFYDPKGDSYIRWKQNLYVVLTRDGVLKTVVRGPIARRWQPL